MCVLTATPNTIHVVRGPLTLLEGGVVTLCGRRGFAREVPWHVTRRCGSCQRAQKQHDNQEGHVDDGS